MMGMTVALVALCFASPSYLALRPAVCKLTASFRERRQSRPRVCFAEVLPPLLGQGVFG